MGLLHPLANGPHPGDIRQVWKASVAGVGTFPVGVFVLSTPLDGFKAQINYDVGLYAQDTWTLNRFTFNLGVRSDIFKNGNPAQSSPAGTWVPARDFPELPAADWKTLVPRLGVAYRRLRQRQDGPQSVRPPVCQSGIDDARTGGEPDGELYLGRSAGVPRLEGFSRRERQPPQSRRNRPD